MKISRLLISLIIITICLVTINYSQVQAKPGSGAIWTTSVACGKPDQDLNHYDTWAWVWINGANFDPGTYDWFIMGKPGGASTDPNSKVASSTFSVNETGSFCFAAYQIEYGDAGEYGVNFDGKKDNYRVQEIELTPR